MAEQKVKIKNATVEGKTNKKKVMINDAILEGDAVKIPQQSKIPTTTEQENITTAGQRRVNLIWEYTQAFIAIIVILSNMVAGLIYAFRGEEGNTPAILSSSLFLVIGFYFSRTNHQAIGSIGTKSNETQKYEGR